MAGRQTYQSESIWRFRNLILNCGVKVVFAIGAIAFSGSHARAEFSICNKSLDVLNVAVAYDEDGIFKTEGWWSVGDRKSVV